jgi:hypothetical protein
MRNELSTFQPPPPFVVVHLARAASGAAFIHPLPARGGGHEHVAVGVRKSSPPPAADLPVLLRAVIVAPSAAQIISYSPPTTGPGAGGGGVEEGGEERGGLGGAGGEEGGEELLLQLIVKLHFPVSSSSAENRHPRSSREATNRFQLSVERQPSPRRTELDPNRTLTVQPKARQATTTTRA